MFARVEQENLGYWARAGGYNLGLHHLRQLLQSDFEKHGRATTMLSHTLRASTLWGR
jgi:hypothetical protein